MNRQGEGLNGMYVYICELYCQQSSRQIPSSKIMRSGSYAEDIYIYVCVSLFSFLRNLIYSEQ